jgi:membrane-associated phospholipid phosphatase
MIAATFVRRSHRLLWTTAAILLATGVGLSRIYLGVHWATDVIAGWGAAALWVTALLWLFDRVRRGPPQTRLADCRPSGSRPVARGEPGDVGHD